MKVGDLVAFSAYGRSLTIFFKVRDCLGIITDIRIGPESNKKEYLVNFVNGVEHYVFRKEIKYAR